TPAGGLHLLALEELTSALFRAGATLVERAGVATVALALLGTTRVFHVFDSLRFGIAFRDQRQVRRAPLASRERGQQSRQCDPLQQTAAGDEIGRAQARLHSRCEWRRSVARPKESAQEPGRSSGLLDGAMFLSRTGSFTAVCLCEPCRNIAGSRGLQ